jgi:hypothetical protein
VLDKSPDQQTIQVNEAEKYLEQNTLSSILCKEPFVKAAFLSELIKQIEIPIVYIDFDLLYTGYCKAGIIEKKENISLFSPIKDDWNQILEKVLLMISNKKSVVIIDSLNGLYNLLDGKDVGRLVNTYIMLLAFVARESNSTVLFASVGRKKKQEGWVLSPTGRHILDSNLITKLSVERHNSELQLNVFQENTSEVS